MDESSSDEGPNYSLAGTAVPLVKASVLAGRVKPTFAAMVIFPTIISIIYLCFLASDIYVSESRFVVRNANKPTASGIGVLLQTAGMNGSDEVRVAQGFISSRDGLRALEPKALARKAWGGSHVSPLNRFDPSAWIHPLKHYTFIIRRKQSMSSFNLFKAKLGAEYFLPPCGLLENCD